MYAQNVIKLFVMVLGGNSTSLNWWRCVKGSSYKIDLDLEIQGKIDFIACIFYLYTGGDKSFNGSMGRNSIELSWKKMPRSLVSELALFVTYSHLAVLCRENGICSGT